MPGGPIDQFASVILDELIDATSDVTALEVQ